MIVECTLTRNIRPPHEFMIIIMYKNMEDLHV
jgi:hypothetical protein